MLEIKWFKLIYFSCALISCACYDKWLLNNYNIVLSNILINRFLIIPFWQQLIFNDRGNFKEGMSNGSKYASGLHYEQYCVMILRYYLRKLNNNKKSLRCITVQIIPKIYVTVHEQHLFLSRRKKHYSVDPAINTIKK